ncbi:MAG TPA: hypothetical protein VNT30_00745 [Stellaceae bacterium]|nr:hypothetical protein [Stellaceae bacterium]
MSEDVLAVGFETASTRMEPMWLVDVQVPREEADTVMDGLARVVPLVMGNYDRCAFQSAPGLERYRPRDGAAAGAEEETRSRPDMVVISFQIARDRGILDQAVEAIVAVHSYQEPVIVVQEVLASRTKGGDPNNPNRWWNKGGDWMKTP